MKGAQLFKKMTNARAAFQHKLGYHYVDLVKNKINYTRILLN